MAATRRVEVSGLQPHRLQGKAAVITGGSSGIGKATCEALVALGAKVVIADILVEAGAALVHQLNRNEKNAVFELCDVTKPQDIRSAVDACLREFGTFDIMFNNAGVALEAPFGFPFHTTSSVWRKLLDINLTAVIEGTQIACQEFKKSGKGGVVINTASMGGLLPMLDSPIYAATKSGVVHLSRSLAHLKDQENIRVNAICPSFTLTPLVANLGPEVVESMKSQVGGVLNPEDIAKGVVELVLDETKAGAVMRVTMRKGRDYAPFPQGVPVTKAAL